MPLRSAHRPAVPTAHRQRALLAALCVLCVLCAPALSPGPARAEPIQLTVGVESIDYPPYGSFRNGDYEGFARDLLDSFAIEYGYTMAYVPLPVKRLYQEYLEGHSLDLKFPDSPDWHPSRREGLQIAYSVPICSFTDGILVKPENMGKGMKAIKTLGILAGFKPWLLDPPIDSRTVRISENLTISGLLSKGIRGRVDGVYACVQAARHLLTAMGIRDKLVYDPSLPHVNGVYRLSSIRRPRVMRQFDEFMNTRSQLVNSLRRKHGLDR